jgi:hypothetical protein
MPHTWSVLIMCAIINKIPILTGSALARSKGYWNVIRLLKIV